jgi:Uma2 family endonuclease
MRSSSPVRPVIGPYRWADFVALPEDDRRELIDGELVGVEVSASLRHEHIVMTLGFHLKGWAEAHGGMVLGSNYGVRISDTRGVLPDLQVFRGSNLPTLDQDRGLVRSRPDLVVEIISPSSRRYDRIVKLGYYASVHVPEYWIVDPDGCVLERLVWSAKGYVIAGAHEGDEVLAPDTFDGLRIPLGQLWLPAPAKPPGSSKAKKRAPAARRKRAE